MEDIKISYESWIDTKWRPAVAWVYLVICAFDFVAAPVAFSLAQYLLEQPLVQWTPITLQGAGLIHMSFGAVLGITAWGRTREKIEGMGV